MENRQARISRAVTPRHKHSSKLSDVRRRIDPLSE
jgi:hypothetical protein